MLLTVAWDDTDSVFEIVKAYYRRLCDYMQFEDRGMVIGKGCGTPSMTKASAFLQQAYQMGKMLK